MKLLKYWWISSTFLLFSCESESTKPNSLPSVEDSVIVKHIDSSFSKSEDDIIIDSTESQTIEQIDTISIKAQTKNSTNIDKNLKTEEYGGEPSDNIIILMPEKEYWEFRKSEHFKKDSVDFYKWFMNSKFWREEYKKLDSVGYYQKYLHFWKLRLESIEGGFDLEKNK